MQKALAHAGLGSRRQIEEWIRAGRLTVNGTVAQLGQRVGPEDRIQLDGRILRRREGARGIVYLCHRSSGEPLLQPAEATAETRGALAERLPRCAGRRFIAVSPMPRGDGGLEVLTADGALGARLQRAAGRLEIEFSVRVRGDLEAAQIERILDGQLDSGARLELLACEPAGGEAANRWYAVRARGASGRELRQLFERQGVIVSRVLRVRMGSLVLERALARGGFRRLEPAEVEALLCGANAMQTSPAVEAASALSVPGSRSSRRSRLGSPGRAGKDRAP